MNELQTIHETEEFTLNLDCEHLYRHDPTLYTQLVNFPSEMIIYFDSVSNQLYKESYDNQSVHTIMVRTTNLREK